MERTARVPRNAFLLGLAMSMLIACGAASSSPSTSTGSVSSGGAPASGAAAGATSGADTLTGIWQSDPFTAADVDNALRREFSGSAVDRWERVSSCYPKPDQTWEQVLHLAGGQLVVSTAKDGGSAREGWTGSYVRQDANTFRAAEYIKVDYQIKGGRLFTDLIKDDFPHPSQRLGDTMCQFVIYEIAPFTRVG